MMLLRILNSVVRLSPQVAGSNFQLGKVSDSKVGYHSLLAMLAVSATARHNGGGGSEPRIDEKDGSMKIKDGKKFSYSNSSARVSRAPHAGPGLRFRFPRVVVEKLVNVSYDLV